MWGVADRIAKAFSDVTVGTVIVLVHVAIAERQPGSRRSAHDRGTPPSGSPAIDIVTPARSP